MLSTKDISALKSRIFEPNDPNVETFKNNRYDLKIKSEEKVKNWPNTLEAIRIQKEQ